ncbi:MAG TPA: glycoside hydrolase family 3 N-terminal domain-containing protein [Chitinophagaceae bacterium]
MIKTITKSILIASGISLLHMSAHAQLNPAVETKVNALVKQMTLEEKVGQMAQVAIDAIGKMDYGKGTYAIDPVKLEEALVKYKVGSVLNTPPSILLSAQQWNDVVQTLHTTAQKTRLKVPIIYGLDQIHGASYVGGATLFPQQIGQAATWNRDLVRQGGVITAYESRAAGVPWTFSPVLDLAANAQWPRLWETYGEDPYLISELGVAFVKGVQDPLGSKEKLAVSLKHYMGYGDPKSGKDRTNAWIPEHYLREYHLPQFRAAVKAGARNVMVNSALINGVPVHMNKHILTDILKNELGFTGFIVTDWQDIENIAKRDKIAKNNKEALMLAINAGIDMSMIPYNYKEFCEDLVALVKEGKVAQSRIDDAVRRVLRVKYELDLFTTPVTTVASYPKFGSKEFEQAAYQTAAESVTLLKNNANTLPIRKNERVLVTGPNANTMRALNGGWSYTWQGERTDEIAKDYNTILEALRTKLGEGNVTFEPGVVYKPKGKYWEDSVVNIDAVVSAAANADYVLLCIGENSYTETPGNLQEINLSGNQLALAKAVMGAGKPVIVVLNQGRPRVISSIEPGASAILYAYLPGNFGGNALADILAGDVNPSGKLPVTYPRYSNSLTNYIHKPSDAQLNPQGAYDYSADFNPQYPFGFGLSYTTFAYSDLKVDKAAFDAAGTASISVTVKNTGTREGKEVVQLFISDEYASLTPDVKRLRGFEKVSLKPGESRTVTFKVPMKELAFVNLDNKLQLEEGTFKVQVEKLTTSFEVKEDKVFLQAMTK